MDDKVADEYSPEETAHCFEQAVKRSLNMGHTIQRPAKQKKRGRPRKRKLTPRR